MRKKKKVIRIVVGVFVMCIGVGLILYPIINISIAQNAQNTLLQEIYDLMDAQGAGTPTPMPLARTSVTPGPNDANNDDYYDNGEGDDQGSTQGEKHYVHDGNLSPIDKQKRIEADFNNLIFQEEEEPQPTATVLESERLRGQRLFGIIQIPAIDLIYAIVEGTTSYNIGVAIGHFTDSVAIGAEGNCALAGHRGGTSGPYFKDINKLVEGDTIVMTDLTKTEYTYTVIDSFVVDPTSTYVAKDLGVDGKFLTLVTCTQNGTMRLVVRAKIVE